MLEEGPRLMREAISMHSETQSDAIGRRSSQRAPSPDEGGHQLLSACTPGQSDDIKRHQASSDVISMHARDAACIPLTVLMCPFAHARKRGEWPERVRCSMLAPR